MQEEGGTTPVQDESPSIGEVGKAMSFLSNFMKQQQLNENTTNNILLTSNNEDVISQQRKVWFFIEIEVLISTI